MTILDARADDVVTIGDARGIPMGSSVQVSEVLNPLFSLLIGAQDRPVQPVLLLARSDFTRHPSLHVAVVAAPF